MSYILDALKKLEHDKSRKSCGDGVVSISGALFETEPSKPTGTAGWKIVLAVVVAVLLTFIATWQFLQSDKGRDKATQRTAVPALRVLTPPPVAVESAPPQPVTPVVPVQQNQPAATPPAPVPVLPARPSVQLSKPHKTVVPAATVTQDAAAELTSHELNQRTKEQKSKGGAAVQAIAAPADIKLSGIAWQEDRRARRAVVNGFLMQEGGVVSGARITDIFQDRVRFSLSGSVFEIPLASSGIPTAGK